MDIPGCSIIGQAPQKAGVLSFNIDGFSAQEIAEGLNAGSIAIDQGIIALNPFYADLVWRIRTCFICNLQHF